MKNQCIGVLFFQLIFFQSLFAQAEYHELESPRIGTQNEFSTISNSCNKSTGRCIGKKIWEGGLEYDGEFNNGQIEGTGIFKNRDEFIYEGSFKNGVPDGQGDFRHDNGTNYNGEWKRGKMEGNGFYTFPSGEEYYGPFKNGKFDGDGVLRIKKNESIIGTWINGKLEGKGMHTFDDGSVFEGLFSDGLKNGIGQLVWESGDTLKGFWTNGMLDQKSEFIFKDGSRIIQNWNQGKLKKNISYSQKEGLTFTGDIKEIKNLIINTSLSKTENLNENFPLAWLVAAREYEKQGDLTGALNQIEFAQFFINPFEDSMVAHLVESTFDQITEDKRKIDVAKKEEKGSKSH